MCDRAALLRTVIAHPDDDTPRLVYADWLDDHGEADRAELIRVQCELARAPARARRRVLRGWEAELLEAHGGGWAAPALGAHAPRFAPPVWDRGFVSACAILESGRAAALDLFAAHPVRKLCYVVGNDRLGEVATFRPLGRVETLVVSTSALVEREVARFCRGRRFGRLTSLQFVTRWPVAPEVRERLVGRFGPRVTFRRHRR
ncbi:MAG: TIGR02996 domain-containing protein [Gemmataceae bacterium]|nr:TIGR02996 domain-containing protein [Gemmataceae bacterium]